MEILYFVQGDQKIDFKEVKVTSWVEQHDLDIKMSMVRRFLENVGLVKITIYHKKGQDMRDLATRQASVLKGILISLQNDITVEVPPKMSGNTATFCFVRKNVTGPEQAAQIKKNSKV